MEYLDFAIELARTAGDVLKRYMGREKQVEFKGRANLVTAADKESEALIINRIRQRYPNHAILAEESGASGGGEDKWIIDPLDGTTNFAHQYPGLLRFRRLRTERPIVRARLCTIPLDRRHMSAAGRFGLSVRSRRKRRRPDTGGRSWFVPVERIDDPFVLATAGSTGFFGEDGVIGYRCRMRLMMRASLSLSAAVTRFARPLNSTCFSRPIYRFSTSPASLPAR